MASAWNVLNALSFRSVKQWFTPKREENNNIQQTEINEHKQNENLPDGDSNKIQFCPNNSVFSPMQSEQLVHKNKCNSTQIMNTNSHLEKSGSQQHPGANRDGFYNGNFCPETQTFVESERMDETVTDSAPLTKSASFNNSCMKSPVYIDNNHRQTQNTPINPNKRTQLFVNQQEPNNKLALSGPNVNVSDVVYSNNHVTSECNRTTIGVHNGENNRFSHSGGIFGTYEDKSSFNEVRNVDNGINKVENQQFSWGKQAVNFAKGLITPQPGYGWEQEAFTGGNDQMNKTFNQMENYNGSMCYEETPRKGNMIPSDKQNLKNSYNLGPQTGRLMPDGGPEGNRNMTHSHSVQMGDRFVAPMDNYSNRPMGTYQEQRQNESTPFYPTNVTNFGQSQSTNLDQKVNTYSSVSPNVGQVAPGILKIGGMSFYNDNGQAPISCQKQGQSSSIIHPDNTFSNPISGNKDLNLGKSKRKEKEPDHFDGVKAEWPDYICHFEQVALWNRWSEQEKASQLAMSLRGSAQRVLSELTMQDLTDYMILRTALSQRFNPPERETAHRCEFRTRRRNKEESAADHGYSLKRLASRAFPNIPMAMRETLIIEQYVSGLGNPELKRHVQFAHPSTLDRAISLAVEFEAFEGSQNAPFRKPRPEDPVTQVHAVRQNNSANTADPKISELADSVKNIQETLANLAKNRRNFRNNHRQGYKTNKQ